MRRVRTRLHSRGPQGVRDVWIARRLAPVEEHRQFDAAALGDGPSYFEAQALIRPECFSGELGAILDESECPVVRIALKGPNAFEPGRRGLRTQIAAKG